jgi:hypothetical protein
MSIEEYTPIAVIGAVLLLIRMIRADLNAGRRPRSPAEMQENLKADSGRPKDD